MQVNKPYFRRITIFTFFLILISAVSISAATFTVLNTDDSGAGSFRQAILDANAAAGADNIVFDSGVFSSPQTITLTSGEITFPNSNADATITGPGANLLTISGNNNSRIFTLSEISTVVISGMTLTNGNSTAGLSSGFGGAIYSRGDLTIDGLIVTNNSSTNDGGGIYSSTGDSLTILNSTISNNTSNDTSGGVHAHIDSTLVISNSTISGNTSVDFGGGLYIELNATAMITTSTITDNESQLTTTAISGAGGGIFNESANLTLTDSTVSNNRAPNGGGGGIGFDINSSVMIMRSTISGNTSAGDGAGLNIEDSEVDIINSTISGNTITGTGDGGGIFRNGTLNLVTLSYTTLVNNTATGVGGGINTTTADVGNSIIANNTDNGTALNYSGTLNSQDYNLIEDITGTTINGTTTNNITGQDPLLGILGDYGGPTETHASLSGSPARDAANPGDFPSTDQRGNLRPADSNFSAFQNSKSGVSLIVLGAFPDIGAFEALAPTAAAVSISGKVFASAKGRGLFGAVVHLTDQNGNIRTARTNPFGYYRIDNLEAGQTVIVNVFSKRHQFSPHVLTVNNSLQNINFFPQ